MPTVDQIQRRITRPTTVTSTVDGRDHLLGEQATTAGLVAGHGEYTALCGRPVVAASLVTPPGPTCLDCETALHRATTTSTTSHRREGWVTRLLHRCAPRAGSRSATADSLRRCGRDALVRGLPRRRRHAPRRARATRFPDDRALRRQAVPPPHRPARCTARPGTDLSSLLLGPARNPLRSAESTRWPRSRHAPLATGR